MSSILLKKALQRALNFCGYAISRLPSEQPTQLPEQSSPLPSPLATLIKHHKIETIIDVGANEGQFGIEMRQQGFKGLIISVEPLNQALDNLKSVAKQLPPWEVHRFAAGETNGEIEINISENLQSSSILSMAAQHEQSAPNSRYISKETVPMRTLDSFFDNRLNQLESIFLKLDVQGYEKHVLLGAPNLLAKSVGILVEASLVPLYHGSILIDEMISTLNSEGYILKNIERVFGDEQTQQLLQVDCAFFRELQAE